MAFLESPLLLGLTILALTFVSITPSTPSTQFQDSSFDGELDQLKSRISFLESSIGERDRELRTKDVRLGEMEKITHKESESVASLQNEVEKLRRDIEMQDRKKDALVDRAKLSGERIQELILKLEDLQKVNDDQKTRILETERTLRVVEKEIMKAKLEGASNSKESMKVHWLSPWLAVHIGQLQYYIATHWSQHGRPALDVMIEAVKRISHIKNWLEPCIGTIRTEWIPLVRDYWLAFTTYVGQHVRSLSNTTYEVYDALRTSTLHHVVTVAHELSIHIGQLQSHIEYLWNKHGRPALNATIYKVMEKGSQVKNWVEPHIETVRTEWTPGMKHRLFAFVSYLEPHVRSLSWTASEVYHGLRSSMVHHFATVHNTINPYFQEVKKSADPYIREVATAAKQYSERLRTASKPYIREVVPAYRKFIKYASEYHGQIQEMLRTNELTGPLANMDLAWFVASALLVLPVILLFQLYWAIVSEKTRRQSRASHTTNHKRRRVKRRRPDN